MERVLSNHVVSRIYRSPEIILLEKYYDTGVDIWSMGCILAEMLISLHWTNTKVSNLFPGNSCFPLSPAKERHLRDDDTKLGGQVASKDLMICILNVLGLPSTVDQSFISDVGAYDYIANIYDTNANQTNRLSELF